MSDKKQIDSLEQLCLQVALRIRDAVQPQLGQWSMRGNAGTAHSGDQTFSCDVLAEDVLARTVEELDVTIAVISEDRGQKVYGQGEPVCALIVDPIDGTRGACIGLETVCVSVAAILQAVTPRYCDILAGAVVRMPTRDCFSAGRGTGARLNGQPLLCPKRTPEQRSSLFWSTEIAGRPAGQLFQRLAPLVDQTSRTGGMFIWNSSAYSLTAIATGNLDSYVDLSPPDGSMGLFGYDIAAAYLILLEAGGVCVLPNGSPLDDILLIDPDGHFTIQQLVSCQTEAVRRYITELIGTGDAPRSP